MQIDFIELPVRMFRKSSEVIDLEELGLDCEEETEYYTEKQCLRVDQISGFYPIIEDDGTITTKIVTGYGDQLDYFVCPIAYNEIKNILTQITGIKIWSVENNA